MAERKESNNIYIYIFLGFELVHKIGLAQPILGSFVLAVKLTNLL